MAVFVQKYLGTLTTKYTKYTNDIFWGELAENVVDKNVALITQQRITFQDKEWENA